MNIGFIYCLKNECMPGICKIGKTDRAPSQRCKELSDSTSAPVPFDIQFYVEVQNPLMVERQIHIALDSVRVNQSREFFSCTPAEAYYWLQCNTDIFTEYLDGDVVLEVQQMTDAAVADFMARKAGNVIEVDF